MAWQYWNNVKIMLLIISLYLSNKYELSFVVYVDRNKRCLFVFLIQLKHLLYWKWKKHSMQNCFCLIWHRLVSELHRQNFTKLNKKFNILLCKISFPSLYRNTFFSCLHQKCQMSFMGYVEVIPGQNQT